MNSGFILRVELPDGRQTDLNADYKWFSAVEKGQKINANIQRCNVEFSGFEVLLSILSILCPLLSIPIGYVWYEIIKNKG